MAYDAWGDSWGPAGAGAWGVSWYHAGDVVVDDTHDGFDEVKKRASAFKSKRERLREVLTQAWDGPGAVAAEVQALASPFVEILESGSPRIDFEAIERHKTVMAELLAFQDSLRAEYQQRLDDEEDDDVTMLLWS